MTEIISWVLLLLFKVSLPGQTAVCLSWEYWNTTQMRINNMYNKRFITAMMILTACPPFPMEEFVVDPSATALKRN
jgi:hypothetical protein